MPATPRFHSHVFVTPLGPLALFLTLVARLVVGRLLLEVSLWMLANRADLGRGVTFI